MVQAPVGWHCRSCVRRNARKSPVVRYQPGMGRPGFRQAPVTFSLIAVNVIIYVIASLPAGGPSGRGEAGVLVAHGQWYRLITSMFIHYSVAHIGLNMLSLFVIGRGLEPAIGPWRYLGLYLVSGFGGSVAVYLFTNPDYASAGASGAIFGLLGAYFVVARRARANTSQIVVIIAINLVYSFSIPGISWQAHMGGLVTGGVIAICSSWSDEAPAGPSSMPRPWPSCVALLAVLVVALPPGRVDMRAFLVLAAPVASPLGARGRRSVEDRQTLISASGVRSSPPPPPPTVPLTSDLTTAMVVPPPRYHDWCNFGATCSRRRKDHAGLHHRKGTREVAHPCLCRARQRHDSPRQPNDPRQQA